MLTGMLKWIFKNFVPYFVGVVVGASFFFLLVRMLPMLPEISVLNWPMAEKEESHTSTPATQAIAVKSATSTAPPEPIVVDETSLEAYTTPQQKPERSQDATTLEKVSDPEKRSADNSATEQALEESIEQKQVGKEDRLITASTIQTSPVPESSASVPAANKSTSEQTQTKGCGTPPTQPGRAMDQYLVCQWRKNCLNRLSRARKMIQQDKKRCPSSGANSLSCLAYYRSLEKQYHPALCGGWSALQAPGRW